jgi:peptide/nickel transport system substrate-binding protein
VSHGSSRWAVHRWLAPLAAIALLAVGCNGGEGTEAPDTTAPDPPPAPVTPVEGGVLRVASGPLPSDWSPTATRWDTSAQQVARGLYDRLAVYDQDGVAVPQLAESVEPDADFTTWTIRLRRGVLFHDGTPLHADDVVANLQAQRSSPVGADLLAPVIAVEATSALVVVVTTDAPWSTFVEALATQVGFVASPSTLVGGGATPVGTGPFRAAAPAAGSVVGGEGGVALEANPFYWQPGLPRLDGVTFPVHVDPVDRVSAVIGGDADLVATDRPVQLARLERAADRGDVRVIEDRNAELPKAAVALNAGQAPFDRLTARRAAGLATDRAEMVDEVLDGDGVVSRGILSDPSPWFSDLPEPVPDTARARSEAATYTEDSGETLTVELLVPSDPLLVQLARTWRDQLAEVDIGVTVVEVDAGDLRDRMRRGQYQAALIQGFTSPHPDLYEPLFRGIPGEQPADNPNLTRYVDPLITETFADARATAAVADQVEAYRIFQEQLFLEVPWLFLVQIRQGIGAAPDVRDVTTWTVAGGRPGQGQDGLTVELALIWRDPQAGDGSTTTVPPSSTPSRAASDASPGSATPSGWPG